MAQTGRVKWFDSRMGYGFVVPDAWPTAPPPDLFVHRRVVRRAGRRTLEPGETVEYELEETPSGFKLTWMRVVG